MIMEPASRDLMERIARPGKVQALVLDFVESEYSIAKITFSKNEYKTAAHAQSSFSQCIRRLRVRVIARTYNGELYLIRQ